MGISSYLQQDRLAKLHFQQLQGNDCGTAAVKCMLALRGKQANYHEIDETLGRSPAGSSLYDLKAALETFGLASIALKVRCGDLIKGRVAPCILHMSGSHFIVVKHITKKELLVSDPAGPGAEKISHEAFASLMGGEDTVIYGVWVAEESGASTLMMKDEVYDSAVRTGFDLVWPFRRVIFVISAVTIFLSIVGLVVPLAIANISSQASTDEDTVSFVFALLIIFVVLTFRECLTVVRGSLAARLSAFGYIELVRAFLRSVLQLPVGRFFRQGTGETLARIEDYRNLQRYSSDILLSALFSLFFVLAVVATILSLSIRAGAFVASGIIGYLVISSYFMAARRSLEFKRFREDSKARGVEIRLLQGFIQFKALGIEESRLARWEEVNESVARVHIGLARVELRQAAISAIFYNGLMVTVLYVLASEPIENVGIFLAVAILVMQLKEPLTSLVGFWRSSQDVHLASLRISLFNQFKQEPSGCLTMEATAEGASVAFRDVTFGYTESGTPALERVCFALKSGETFALVGESGAGKSTVFSLILRFFEPSHGIILLDGLPLKDFNSRTLRRQIGTVLQDGIIFEGTLTENIVAGEALDEHWLHQVLDACCCDEFIKRLPGGLNSLVGTDGLPLSGGERQRILLARAVYRRPRLLMLDEATSALDAETEWQVMQGLGSLLPSCSKLVSAHRLSTIKGADQIAVMAKGKITEIGNHATLLALNGRYAKLIGRQAGTSDVRA